MAITLEQRRELGRQGELWRLTVDFNDRGKLCQHTRNNLTGGEVMKLRETLVRAGLTHFLDPGHWKIILPHEITNVECWKQARYWE